MNAINLYIEWVKKNMFTVIGIIIILLITMYDVATVQKQKMDVLNKVTYECNKFYVKEVKKVCPALFADSTYTPEYTPSFNLSLIFAVIAIISYIFGELFDSFYDFRNKKVKGG